MRISDWSSDVCSSDHSSTPPGSEGSSSKPESDGPSSAPGSDASLLPTYPPAVETPPGDPSGDGSAGLDDISGDAPETDLKDEERSDERRVGKECVSKWRPRGSQTQ